MTDSTETREEVLEEEKTEETAGQAAEETKQESGETADSGKEREEEKEEEVKEEGQEAGQDDNDLRYLRLMADFQNYKKRVEKEKTDLYSYANEKIMGELLSVLDNFERALDTDAGDGFREGIEMIFKQLTDVLEKSGLAEIPALGEEFDPNVHSAVMTEETEDYESGKVSGVMQKGYTLNGKVIRPSMVKVAN